MTDYTELKQMAETVNQICHGVESPLMGIETKIVLALIAENERLEIERADLWRGKRDVEATRDTKSAVIAELKAEVAGLKTGYEAYELVNAELKAESEALRRLAPSKEIIWCACGDGYPVNSHGAGFMDANDGVCANCDAAMGKGELS